MTAPEDQQSPAERAAKDLAYVREAIERQQRFVGERLPLWLAASAGIGLAIALSMKDFFDPMLAKYSLLGVAALLATIVSLKGRGKKKKADCQVAGWRMFVPWLGMFAGFAMLGIVKGQLGLSGDEMRIIFLLVFATGAISVGNMGLLVMRGMGLGAIAAMLGFMFVPAYAGSIAGLGLGLGLYLGTLADHRQQTG